MLKRALFAAILFAAAPAWAVVPATKMSGAQLTPNATTPIQATKQGVWVDLTNRLRFDDGTTSNTIPFGTGTTDQLAIWTTGGIGSSKLNEVTTAAPYLWTFGDVATVKPLLLLTGVSADLLQPTTPSSANGTPFFIASGAGGGVDKNGGDLFLDSGSPTGAGTAGGVKIGTTVPSVVTIGNSLGSITLATNTTLSTGLTFVAGANTLISGDKLQGSQLSTSGVAAGSYTSANITVSAGGIITAAASGGAGPGTVTGTGTTGKITLWSDGAASTIADSQISDNGTSVTISTAGDVNLDGANQIAIGTTNAVDILFGRSARNIIFVGNVTVSGTPTLNWPGTLTLGDTIWTTGKTLAVGGNTFVSGDKLQGGQIASATVPSAALVNTAVTPGSYTAANITVNAEGQITAAANGTVGTVTGTGTTGKLPLWTNGAGGVLGDSQVSDNGTSVTISTLGDVNLDGANQIAIGTTNAVDILFGRSARNIIFVGNVTVSGTPTFNWPGTLTLGDTIWTTGKTLAVGGNTFVSGDKLQGGQIASATVPSAALVNTAVTPGSYTSANITVNAEGQITAAASGGGGTVTGSGTTGTIPVWTGSAAIGDSSLTSSSGNLTLATTKTFASGANTLVSGDKLQGGQIASATVPSAALVNTAVTPGSYTNTSLTVNAEGQITAASSGSGGTISGLTTNTIPRASSATAIADSALIDNGTTITASEDFTPSTDNVRNLGSSALRWASVHVGPGSVVIHNDATNTQKITLSYVAGVPTIGTAGTGSLTLATGGTAGITIDASQNVTLSQSGVTTTINGDLVVATGKNLRAGGNTIVSGDKLQGGQIASASIPTAALVSAPASGNSGQFGVFTSTTAVGNPGSSNTITQAVATSGSPTGLLFTGAAHTTLTQAEVIDVNYNLSRTVQLSTTGNQTLAVQRAFLIQPPTYSEIGGGSNHITEAATFAVSGAPAQGANTTIDNPYSLWVQGGIARFAGKMSQAASIVNDGDYINTIFQNTQNYNGQAPSGAGAFRISGGTITSGNNVELIDVLFDLSYQKKFNNNPVATQRSFVVNGPVLGSAGGACTITKAATMAIAGPPTTAATVTITSAYAFWVQTGKTELDGGLVVAGALLNTVGTTLSGNHTVQVQNSSASGFSTVLFNDSSGTGRLSMGYGNSGVASPYTSTAYIGSAGPLKFINDTAAAAMLTIDNGSVTVNGTATFTSGSGTVAINGSMTLAANKNITGSAGTTALDFSGATGAIRLGASTATIGLYGATATAQYNTAGTTTGFTANASANTVFNESTFTGGLGTTAYTISDLTLALKRLGAIAQ